MIESAKEEYSLRDILNNIMAWLVYLRAKWIIITVIALAGTLLGLYKYATTKNLYKATLTYVLSEPGNNTNGLSSLASQFGLSSSQGGFALFEGGNFTDLMQSRSILQKVLLSKMSADNDTLIGDKYISVYELRKNWIKNKSSLAKIYFKNLKVCDTLPIIYNILVNELIGNIKSKNLSFNKVSKESNLSAITFSSENEMLSKVFVDVLANVVSKYYVQIKTEKFSKNVRILQNQTDSVRKILRGDVSSVAALTDINPNLNPSRRTLLAPSQNKQIDVQASTAILNQLVQNLELAKLQLRNETPLFQIVDQPILPLDVVKWSLMKCCLAGFFTGFILIVMFFSLQLFFKSLL